MQYKNIDLTINYINNMRYIYLFILLFFAELSEAQQFKIQQCTNNLYGVSKPLNSRNVKWIIDPIYKNILSIKNSNNCFLVQSEVNSLWGVISIENKVLLPLDKSYFEIQDLISGNFSNYAKQYVERNIKIWQQRGEFEKTEDYKKRVNVSTRDNKVQQYIAEAQKHCYRVLQFWDVKTHLESYDPDNETFLIKTDIEDLIVPVPISKAQIFKEKFPLLKKKVEFDLVGWKPEIKQVDFKLEEKTLAIYKVGNKTRYVSADIKYNFDPIVILDETFRQKEQLTAEAVTLEIGKSDVDINVPLVKVNAKNTFAVIIANESYSKEARVPFASTDGRVFGEYCKRTLGLPENNIHIAVNATLNDIRHEIKWLKDIIGAFNGEAKVIFYYAGHGIPDEKQQSAYLLPVDGYASDVATGYALDSLYSSLGKLPSKSVTVFLDACFSGTKREGGMLVVARGVAIKAKPSTPVGNMVVLSATQSDETAFPLKEKGHGMFTYYLLKKIQETKGNVSLEELSSYVKEQVRQQSVVINGKVQTPTVNVSSSLGDDWKSWKLR